MDAAESPQGTRQPLAQYSRDTLRSETEEKAVEDITPLPLPSPPRQMDFCMCFAQCLRTLFRVPHGPSDIPVPARFGRYLPSRSPTPPPPMPTTMPERVRNSVVQLQRARSETGYNPYETQDITALRLRLDPTRSISKRYQMTGRRLGQGGYASVYEVMDKASREIRAVKIISKLRVEDLDLLEQELSVLLSLDHPNVIRLLEWFDGGSNIYLIMECCDGGELFDVLEDQRHKEELFTGSIVRQIFQGVAYLHQNGVVHRDLKLENCLFKSKDPGSSVKLIDFGLAGLKPREQQAEGAWLQEMMGTALYMAPEVIEGGGIVSYDEKCDIWGVGVITYILLTGVHPFWTPPSNVAAYADEREVFRKVLRDSVDLSCIPSPAAAELVGVLLEKDPTKRPSATQALNHRWLRQLDLFPASQQRKLLKNLKSFGNFRRLERAVLTVIAFSIRDRELELIRETFALLDRDSSGALSRDEIIEGMRRLAIAVPEDLDAILGSIDADQSGNIDYTEFVAAVMGRNHVLQKEAVDAAFNWFDQSGDGRIDQAELEDVAGLDDAAWALNMFDRGGKNYLTRDDFDRVVNAIAEIKDKQRRSCNQHGGASPITATMLRRRQKRRTASWAGLTPLHSLSGSELDRNALTPTGEQSKSRAVGRRSSDAQASRQFGGLRGPSMCSSYVSSGSSVGDDMGILSPSAGKALRGPLSAPPAEVLYLDSPSPHESAPAPAELFDPVFRSVSPSQDIDPFCMHRDTREARDSQAPSRQSSLEFPPPALELVHSNAHHGADLKRVRGSSSVSGQSACSPSNGSEGEDHFDAESSLPLPPPIGVVPGTPLPASAAALGRSGLRNPLDPFHTGGPGGRSAPELYPVTTIFERSRSAEGGHLCSGLEGCECSTHRQRVFLDAKFFNSPSQTSRSPSDKKSDGSGGNSSRHERFLSDPGSYSRLKSAVTEPARPSASMDPDRPTLSVDVPELPRTERFEGSGKPVFPGEETHDDRKVIHEAAVGPSKGMAKRVVLEPTAISATTDREDDLAHAPNEANSQELREELPPTQLDESIVVRRAKRARKRRGHSPNPDSSAPVYSPVPQEFLSVGMAEDPLLKSKKALGAHAASSPEFGLAFSDGSSEMPSRSVSRD